jgi:hypothetical protein
MSRISRREYLFATHVPFRDEKDRYTTPEIGRMLSLAKVEAYRIGARLCRKGIIRKDPRLESCYVLTNLGELWCLETYPLIWAQDSE